MEDYWEYFLDFNWVGFLIAFGLLGILPVWILNLTSSPFMTRVITSLFIGFLCFVIIKHKKGSRRGLIAR